MRDTEAAGEERVQPAPTDEPGLGQGPLVVAFDGSEGAGDALRLGEAIARARGLRLLVVHVYRPQPFWAQSDDEEAAWPKVEAGRVLERAVALVGGGEVETRLLPGTSVPRELHHLSEQEAAEMIVVGSSARGEIGLTLPGSIGYRLLHGGRSPVLTAPRGFRAPDRLDVVGVGHDGSEEAAGALVEARKIARGAGARLRIVGVLQGALIGAGGAQRLVVPGEAERAREQRRLEDLVAGQPEDVRAESLLLAGLAAEQLVEATASLDLLVLGSRSYGPLRHVLLGSDAAGVMDRARCPVLVVPRPASRVESEQA